MSQRALILFCFPLSSIFSVTEQEEDTYSEVTSEVTSEVSLILR